MGRKRDALVRQLQGFRRKVARRHRVQRMLLFGSRARDRPRRHSDVDLILVGDWFQRKSALRRGYELHLLWDLDLPVDFLCYTPAEFRALSRRPGIVREALREGLEVPA